MQHVRPLCFGRAGAPLADLAMLLVLAVVGVIALLLVTPARADPLPPNPNVFEFQSTCPGLGDVLTTNIAQSQSEAFQVVGTHMVILLGQNVPGLIDRAQAVGTTCTVTARGTPGDLQPVNPPLTVSVIIVP